MHVVLIEWRELGPRSINIQQFVPRASSNPGPLGNRNYRLGVRAGQILVQKLFMKFAAPNT
jgi:hypothetical protein